MKLTKGKQHQTFSQLNNQSNYSLCNNFPNLPNNLNFKKGNNRYNLKTIKILVHFKLLQTVQTKMVPICQITAPKTINHKILQPLLRLCNFKSNQKGNKFNFLLKISIIMIKKSLFNLSLQKTTEIIQIQQHLKANLGLKAQLKL